MFENEGIKFTPKQVTKYLSFGASLAIFWLLLFVVGGFIWSLIKVEDIGLRDHFFNGWAIANLAHFISIVFACSVGLYALFSMGRSIRKNLVILGFVIMHFVIVAIIWTGFSNDGIQDRRKAEANKTLIEKMRDIDWPDRKKD